MISINIDAWSYLLGRVFCFCFGPYEWLLSHPLTPSMLWHGAHVEQKNDRRHTSFRGVCISVSALYIGDNPAKKSRPKDDKRKFKSQNSATAISSENIFMTKTRKKIEISRQVRSLVKLTYKLFALEAEDLAIYLEAHVIWPMETCGPIAVNNVNSRLKCCWESENIEPRAKHFGC